MEIRYKSRDIDFEALVSRLGTTDPVHCTLQLDVIKLEEELIIQKRILRCTLTERESLIRDTCSPCVSDWNRKRDLDRSQQKLSTTINLLTKKKRILESQADCLS